MINFSWTAIDQVENARIYEARAQLHQAIQLLTATAISYGQPKPDDSHTALLWESGTNTFVSQPFGPHLSFNISMGVMDLTCRVIHQGESFFEISLHHTTLQQVASDLKFLLEDHGLPKNEFTMARHFELPDYAERWTRPFDISDRAAFELLRATYHNAYPLLRNLVQEDGDKPLPMTWPHHFDMAVLLPRHAGRSIGVGVSPGDDSYSAPYHYVNVWPYPKPEAVKDKMLTHGRWHMEGWIGMVLHLEDILTTPDPQAQCNMVETFHREAIGHAEDILGEPE